MAISQMPIAADIFGAKATNAAWKQKPSYAVIPQQDRMINPELMRFMTKRAKSATIELPDSHAIFRCTCSRVLSMVRKALVRRPGPRLSEGIVDHIERVPVDCALAVKQWEQYVALLRQHDWEPIEVERADDCPDSVFVEDTMVVYENMAMIARSGALSRRPEIVGAERTIERLGYSIDRVREPGTLDGGDVLKVADLMYVGRSGRTNAEGVAQMRRVFQPLGATVVEVPVSKVLHLKSAATALPNGSVIGYPPFLDDASIFPDFIPVPEPAGAHVVLLGGNRLLMAASAPRSAELFAGLGYEPIVVDISEYEKLEGCVTCLSVRLRGL